jgi:hypothetical protein
MSGLDVVELFGQDYFGLSRFTSPFIFTSFIFRDHFFYERIPRVAGRALAQPFCRFVTARLAKEKRFYFRQLWQRISE